MTDNPPQSAINGTISRAQKYKIICRKTLFCLKKMM